MPMAFILFFSQTGAGPSRVPAKFLEGEKGESFAKAFSKILQQKTKKQTKQIPEAADSPVEEGPILAVSDRISAVLFAHSHMNLRSIFIIPPMAGAWDLDQDKCFYHVTSAHPLSVSSVFASDLLLSFALHVGVKERR